MPQRRNEGHTAKDVPGMDGATKSLGSCLGEYRHGGFRTFQFFTLLGVVLLTMTSFMGRVAYATPSYYVKVSSSANAGSSSYDGSVLSTPGLTGDSVSVGSCGTASNGASAAASLSQGAVRACAAGVSTNEGGDGYSEVFDTLHFTIPGATSATTTNIGVRLHFDGVASGPEAASEIELRLGVPGGLSGTEGVFDHLAITPGPANNPAAVLADTATYWKSYSITNSGFDGVDFSGVFSLDGASPSLTLDLWADVKGQDGSSSNFSNTGFVNLTLPQGVSYASSSGVFLSSPLSAPLPEPSSLTLLAMGVGSVAAFRLRRARTCS